MKKYRIIINDWDWYVIQVKYQFIPFWITLKPYRYYECIEDAKKAIEKRKNRVVYTEE